MGSPDFVQCRMLKSVVILQSSFRLAANPVRSWWPPSLVHTKYKEAAKYKTQGKEAMRLSKYDTISQQC